MATAAIILPALFAPLFTCSKFPCSNRPQEEVFRCGDNCSYVPSLICSTAHLLKIPLLYRAAARFLLVSALSAVPSRCVRMENNHPMVYHSKKLGYAARSYSRGRLSLTGSPNGNLGLAEHQRLGIQIFITPW